MIKKNALYLSVNVFSTKVLIGTLYFTSPNGDGTAILRGHPSHAKVQPPAGQRKYLHFSVIFKTLSIGPAAGIEPATSRSVVKRSTDWANPAAVKCHFCLVFTLPVFWYANVAFTIFAPYLLL